MLKKIALSLGVAGLLVPPLVLALMTGLHFSRAEAQTFVPTNITPIRCTVTVSTATTIQAVGGSCVAPGAGFSLYVTDVLFSSSASGIGADAFATLKYGTGGTCGTGTTVFWGALSAAANITQQQFQTPIKIPANNEICWINTTAGSKFVVISGFIGR